MKKKILAICLAAIIAVIAIAGASLAYLTDIEEQDNVFTFGNVDIKLLESTLHRDNDRATDEQIIADAENYQDYLADAGKNMVPGVWVKKAPYIQNVGSNAAYVRITVEIPENIDPLLHLMPDTTGMNNGAFTMGDPVTADGVTRITFTFTEPLEPDEVTYYAPFWQFKLNDDLDNEDLEDLRGVDVAHSITVSAEAIQAEGFANAAEAFAAFDAQ